MLGTQQYVRVSYALLVSAIAAFLPSLSCLALTRGNHCETGVGIAALTTLGAAAAVLAFAVACERHVCRPTAVQYLCQRKPYYALICVNHAHTVPKWSCDSETASEAHSETSDAWRPIDMSPLR